MHAGEPHLLNILARQLRAPKIVPKIAAPLVDGEGMPPSGHIGILSGVGKLQRVPDPTYRAYRVPNAHKVQWARPAKCCFEFVGNLKRARHSSGFTRFFRVHRDDVRDQSVVAGTRSPYICNTPPRARTV